MANKKGVFNLQGMFIGMLVLGLFFGMMTFIIGSMSGNYNTEGYDESDLEAYSTLNKETSNLTRDLQEQSETIQEVTVDSGVFDWFAEMWNKLTAPFRFAYQSYRGFTSLFTNASSDLGLPPIFSDFFVSLIVVLVIIGIVMIKFYMARQK